MGAQKWLVRLGVVGFMAILIGLGLVWSRMAERFPERITMSVQAGESQQLKVGFSEVEVALPAFDPMMDTNNNGRYDAGEPYQDLNNNGRLDPLYLAGFSHNRPASGVLDKIKVTAMVVEDGAIKVGFVVADVIGLFRDEVMGLRQELEGIDGAPDYLMMAATHTHSAPDVIGLWGQDQLASGVHPEFLNNLRGSLKQALMEASNSLEPAVLRFGVDHGFSAAFIEDVRDPQVVDSHVTVMRAVAVAGGRTLGHLINWAVHPEALESHNMMVSSDYVHHVREAMGEGVTLFVNGAVGGLMTVSDSFPITSLVDGKTYLSPDLGKIRALGESVAVIAQKALESPSSMEVKKAAFALEVDSFGLPIDNSGFKALMAAGVLDRGLMGFGSEILTEVAAISLGPARFLTAPGEVNPEVFVGGVTTPEGADFPERVIEAPPLRQFMGGRYQFVLGLTNGFLGYFIPKSHWDSKPPYLGGKTRPPYGEVVSLGPDAAATYYHKARQLLEKLDRGANEVP